MNRLGSGFVQVTRHPTGEITVINTANINWISAMCAGASFVKFSNGDSISIFGEFPDYKKSEIEEE